MKKYLIKPKTKVNLKNWDPDDTKSFDGSKDEAEIKLKDLRDKLRNLQELLYAEHKHKVLIVLQAMDTAGKDSTIRFVFQGVNPQGVRVCRFNVPTPEEMDHDYLWRVHAQTPRKGEIMIFNRSHYEDVLTVRVHSLVPKETWSKRYEHICNFERLLSDEGVTILKFFLHISKDEQKKRLQERLDDPTKHWKFQLGDIHERKFWDQYMSAYQDAIAQTSTPWAPWHIVPSNVKWFRNLIITQAIVDALEQLNMRYPKSKIDAGSIRIK